MKYKNINAAIHNFGDSFLSDMNFVDRGYVFDDLILINEKGHDIFIDWIQMKFYPESEFNDRIRESLIEYKEMLAEVFSSLKVDFDRLVALNFQWPAGQHRFMEAIDDRGKYYKMHIRKKHNRHEQLPF